MIIKILIVEYLILAFLSYIFFNRLKLKFIQDNKEVELTNLQKRSLLIIMGMFWIFYLPRLYLDSKKK